LRKCVNLPFPKKKHSAKFNQLLEKNEIGPGDSRLA
jgi:hypothetical protein